MSVAAAFLLIAAAQAAPSTADVACIIDRVPPAMYAALVDEAASGEQGPVRRAFEEAAQGCAAARSWSSEHVLATERAAAAQAAIDQASARLERAGISPQLVRSWFAELPAEDQVDGDRVGAAANALIDDIVAAGGTPAMVEANLQNLGVMIGGLSNIARLRRQDRR